MPHRLTLGYHGLNHTLRKKHIFTDRTARQNTLKIMNNIKRIKFLQDLCKKNVEDLLKIILWNIKNNIYFYRISSGIAPHITNPAFISSSNYRSLVYSLEFLRPLFQEIGNVARRNGMRLTFHPGQYVSLSSSNKNIIRSSFRDLYYHTKILDMMNMDNNSVLVIHGGGIYGDKIGAVKNWIKNYKKLPIFIRRRVVLENDEKNYSIRDVIKISQITGVPIVFDIFHYFLYEKTIEHKRQIGEKIPDQPQLDKIFPALIKSWGSERIKMHISEQRPQHRFGAHSDYVKTIPREILDFPKKYHKNLDLMIEAKANEMAIFYLRHKYNKRVC
jgi:UV DNA damage endonuclease